jgi:hypothetical protein
MGAPFSDQPRSLSPSAAAWTAIGVAEGDGETLGDAPKVAGTDTVPDSFGIIVGVGGGVSVGVGVGVAVEIRTGGVVGVGVAVGDSVGVGGCPKAATMTPKSATTETP